MSGKILISFLLVAGVAAVAFGMLTGNNYVFVIGIVMVVAGYCLIRKDLRISIRKKKNPDPPAHSDED